MIVQCQHCEESVERQVYRGNATCFDCKRKKTIERNRKRAYVPKPRRPRKTRVKKPKPYPVYETVADMHKAHMKDLKERGILIE